MRHFTSPNLAIPGDAASKVSEFLYDLCRPSFKLHWQDVSRCTVAADDHSLRLGNTDSQSPL